jgi:hypothetical protein
MVVAGRPIPANETFRETFPRRPLTGGCGLEPGARRSGSAWGMREPDRHFAASPCHPGGQVTCHRRADLECPIVFTGVRGAPETPPRSTLKSAPIRRKLSTVGPICPTYTLLRTNWRRRPVLARCPDRALVLTDDALFVTSVGDDEATATATRPRVGNQAVNCLDCIRDLDAARPAVAVCFSCGGAVCDAHSSVSYARRSVGPGSGQSRASGSPSRTVRCIVCVQAIYGSVADQADRALRANRFRNFWNRRIAPLASSDLAPTARPQA